MEGAYLSFSPENIVTVLLIVALGMGAWALVGQGIMRATGA
jgi:hypothetical protein